jgi:thioredoxin reductase (NADPH)
VVASGARYRRPDIPNLSTFEGAGVSYWASPIEARLCEGEEVAVVGGGNSAGQAVVFLATKVKRLRLIVRGPGLDATMSRYLIDRIGNLPNVELHVGTEVIALEGDRAQGLTAAVFRDRASRVTHACPLRHLFLFIGADPNAAWLATRAAVDAKGFVLTGLDFADGAGAARGAALPLETGPACSRSAMSARVRPNGWRRRSAKAPPSWRRSIRRSRSNANMRLMNDGT